MQELDGYSSEAPSEYDRHQTAVTQPLEASNSVFFDDYFIKHLNDKGKVQRYEVNPGVSVIAVGNPADTVVGPTVNTENAHVLPKFSLQPRAASSVLLEVNRGQKFNMGKGADIAFMYAMLSLSVQNRVVKRKVLPNELLACDRGVFIIRLNDLLETFHEKV